jgi:hypothetical protein
LAECPLLSRALRGYKKLRPASKSIRVPITTSVLSSLKSKVTGSREDTILWAMMTVGVYGLFRLGELTVRDSSSEPLLMDAYTRVSASHRTIRLASSKTDIAREGVVIHLHANGSPSCPIAALENLFALRIHGVSTAPIFPGKDGKPLSRDAAIGGMRDLLQRAGFDPSLYSAHSLRKGGAQSLFDGGVCDKAIAAIDRWSSDCFRLYFGLTDDARRSFSAKMSDPSRRLNRLLDFSRFADM